MTRLSRGTTVFIFALALACTCFSTALAEKKLDNEKLTLKVEGMTCEGCVKKVKTALLGVSGVVDCHVHLKEKSAHLVVKKGADPSKMIEAVEGAGYEAVVLWEEWED